MPLLPFRPRKPESYFNADTRSDIGSEAEKMAFANSMNELVVTFLRLDYHEPTASDMLVMERLYPIDFRAYEIEKRALFLDVFEDELAALHKAGFAHHDLRRPSGIGGQYFDNILLTERGLRLVDVGISVLRRQVGDLLFEKYLAKEKEELAEFRTYFLNR